MSQRDAIHEGFSKKERDKIHHLIGAKSADKVMNCFPLRFG